MNHDNLPKKNPIWLLFDIGNGDSGSKHYVWWFDSRKKARDYKAWHLKSKSPHKTDLVGPVRATVDKIPPGAFQGTQLAPPPKKKRSAINFSSRTWDAPICGKRIDVQGTTRRCIRQQKHRGACDPFSR